MLISPYAVSHPDPGSTAVHVKLTRQRVRDSPNIDAHKPVSRQHEIQYLRYYGYPTYWGGPNVWGMDAYPAFDGPSAMAALPLGAFPVADPNPEADEPPADTHLRSTEGVKGYHIETIDGTIGHVSGFIFDDEAWVKRYLTVDTRNWWPGGKEVLLATEWIELIDWFGSTVSTTLLRDAIKHSRAYDNAIPVDREYETALCEVYGREGYSMYSDPRSLSFLHTDNYADNRRAWEQMHSYPRDGFRRSAPVCTDVPFFFRVARKRIRSIASAVVADAKHAGNGTMALLGDHHSQQPRSAEMALRRHREGKATPNAALTTLSARLA